MSNTIRFSRISLLAILSCLALTGAAHAAPAKKSAKSAATKKAAPTPAPSADPWAQPSASPSATPSATPSAAPSVAPSATPTAVPAAEPSPTPTAEATPAPVAEKTDYSDDYGKTEGLLGPVKFGPTVTLLSIPHPLQVGLESKYRDNFGVSFMYGVLPKITVKENSLKMDSWDIGAHWHPFQGAFFIGGTFGKQKLTGSQTKLLTASLGGGGTYSQDTTVSVELSTTTLTPMLGWRWEWKSGFFYGMEFGWQLASGAKAALTTSPVVPPEVEATAEYQKIKADLDKAADDYGNQGLPHFTLIQIGWMF